MDDANIYVYMDISTFNRHIFGAYYSTSLHVDIRARMTLACSTSSRIDRCTTDIFIKISHDDDEIKDCYVM